MRVTHVMLGLDAGGAEQLVVQAVAAHTGTWVKPTVVVLDRRRLALANRLERTDQSLLLAPGHPIRAIRWLRKVLRHSDVVHTHAPSVGAAVRLLSRTLPRHARPILVHTEHNLWSSHRPVTRAANRLTLPTVDKLVAVSTAVAESIEHPRGHRPLVHHHGIDRTRLRAQAAAADVAEVREALGLREGNPVVLTVANPRPQKAYDVLLEAFRHQEVQRHDPVLLAIGDGPDLERLRAQVSSEGLDDRVRFLGARDDVPSIMAVADVFVLASHSEGLPVVLMEAATLGLPTIATAVGGVPGMIDEGRTGLLVQRGDVAGLAAAIDHLLSDADMRARMGPEAQRRSHRFDVQATAAWYADLYDGLVPDTAPR